MRNVHLICNAHLDPVWLWQWQEGAAEALSTFRVSVEMIEKYGSFIFNHNEAILYEWVEKYEPKLFAKIQKYVKTGQWNIIGGWYLQPDCNMPCGEAFVRQIAVGRSYFKEKFGKDIDTAINFDPFGHSQGLVQIMAKSGYKYYMFGRPDRDSMKLPAEVFQWKGYEGSSVTACRFAGWYNAHPGKAKEVLEQRLKDHSDWEPLCLLWGVGNHGGGPSKKDLAEIEEMIKEHKDQKIMHSTAQKFFAEVSRKKSNMPVVNKDLNPWAIGCYTSMARIKQKYRQLENDLFCAEKMNAHSWLAGLSKYPKEELEKVQKILLKAQFHDTLPGSAIQEVEEDTLNMMGCGLELASNLKTDAFFALCSGQHKAKDGDCPLIVYNPHPYEIEKIVEGEIHLRDQGASNIYREVKLISNKKEIVCQAEKESSNQNGQWRKKVVFAAKLAPGINRFDCEITDKDKHPEINFPPKNDKYVFKTKQLFVEVSKKTGHLESYKIDGKNLIKQKGVRPLVIMDDADPWGMFKKEHGKVCGTFKAATKKEVSQICNLPKGKTLDAVHIVEDGPIRTIVESIMTYNRSVIVSRYKLPKVGTEIEIEMRVYWNETDRLLKLAIPANFKDSQVISQDAFGIKDLRVDGIENVSQKWAIVYDKKANLALSCINNGTYGSDFSDNEYRLSLLRSPAYSASPVPYVLDRYHPRIDQGERIFNFWLNGSNVSQRKQKIETEALIRNEKEFVLNFYPSGDGKKPVKPISVDNKLIHISAVKQSDKGNDLVVRLFESSGYKKKAKLNIPSIKKTYKLDFDGFEVKTLRINLKTKKAKETDLLEKGSEVVK